MGKHQSSINELCTIVDHLRMMADLLSKCTDIQKFEQDTFAKVFQDIADRLDRLKAREVMGCQYTVLEHRE